MYLHHRADTYIHLLAVNKAAMIRHSLCIYILLFIAYSFDLSMYLEIMNNCIYHNLQKLQRSQHTVD